MKTGLSLGAFLVVIGLGGFVAVNIVTDVDISGLLCFIAGVITAGGVLLVVVHTIINE